MTQIRNNRRPATPRQAAARTGRLDAMLDPYFFKAMCDPTRLRLVSCIARCARPCSVSEVAECCDVDLSVVSRHLALLARAGVLEVSKQGRTVFYQARCAEIATNLRALADALDECCPEGANAPCPCAAR